MSKIYLHYEGERGPDHTFIWRKAGGLPFTGRDLGEALSGFVESYGKKHGREAYGQGKGMDASRLRLVADPPDPLGAAAAAAKAVVLDVTSNAAVDRAIVHTGCDIRVEEGPPRDENGKAKEQKSAGGGATSVGGWRRHRLRRRRWQRAWRQRRRDRTWLRGPRSWPSRRRR
ncbi:unnamed protein product [Ectocarpus sp. 6 AP-2014]